MKTDSKSFIFTLKNAHDVEPTRYMKRKGSKYVIKCNSGCGPLFGIHPDDYDSSYYDISIGDNCNEEDSCYIHNNGEYGYEYDPQYISSLFVNTDGSERENFFRVLDYEVYCIDYKNVDNNNKLSKHPDIIWEYIQTRDISEESLKRFDDDIELLNDLDAIHCEDSNIRLKISQYYFKNPSKLLPNTQIVNEQYDAKLREWLGNDNKWKLIYRASKYGYTASSFHNYCDDKGPTLIVIKSSGGWIFGGYTTKSWNGYGIYNEMI